MYNDLKPHASVILNVPVEPNVLMNVKSNSHCQSIMYNMFLLFLLWEYFLLFTIKCTQSLYDDKICLQLHFLVIYNSCPFTSWNIISLSRISVEVVSLDILLVSCTAGRQAYSDTGSDFLSHYKYVVAQRPNSNIHPSLLILNTPSIMVLCDLIHITEIVSLIQNSSINLAVCHHLMHTPL